MGFGGVLIVLCVIGSILGLIRKIRKDSKRRDAVKLPAIRGLMGTIIIGTLGNDDGGTVMVDAVLSAVIDRHIGEAIGLGGMDIGEDQGIRRKLLLQVHQTG